MYIRILTCSSLSYKERIKNFVRYYMVRRSARIQWGKRGFIKILSKNPEYGVPAEKSVEEAHKKYWKPFRKKVNLTTLRLTKNISGVSNPKFIPHEIFASDIEPLMNQSPGIIYLTYKSLSNHWFPGNIFPRDYFHNIDGGWFDHNLEPVDLNQIYSIIEKIKYPVVMKPNRDSYGGKNIHFPESKAELLKLIEGQTDILVQEEIKKHPFYEQFGKKGLNTLRVNVYRSFIDNNWHVTSAALRMGISGSLDNLSSGGIAALINTDGFLNGFAIDYAGNKYFKHPDTGVAFDQEIPDFEGLKKISLDIANKLFYARLASLDICYDFEGRWKAIEVNITNTSLSHFAQHHGAEFFGEFTDEVYEYCLKNHWALKSDKL